MNLGYAIIAQRIAASMRWLVLQFLGVLSNYKQTAYINIIVTLSSKTRTIRTSMHVEKKTPNLKIICEITHATGKYLQGQ